MNGSTLGERYRVEARIGAGGMAEVYRGVDPVLNRTVAIKILLPQFARDAGFVARFRREAQAAARLNHPAIVGVYDSGADGDTQYIVMEFIEGRTLADFLGAGKRLTTTQALDVAERIAQALDVAHAQGIVHRDIKPANVMVTRDGSVKVMDFGIARMQTLETAPQTSSVLGTPTYLSPEQAQGQQVDGRSDIYSLGIVLYELLTGAPPFTGDSPVAIAYKQVNEIPVPPSSRVPDLPISLDAVVMKALAKNPANRYQDAGELIADLVSVREGRPVSATPLLAGMGEATQVIARPQPTQVMAPAEEPKGASRKVWLGVLIGVLVVAVLGGAGYLLAQSLGGDGQLETFAMPRVIGTTFDQATIELEGLGLAVLDPVEQESDLPEGTVLDQTPAANTLVSTGNEVTLTVAIPFRKVNVPDLTGLSVEAAIAALQAEGLVIGQRTTETSDEFPDPGIVIGQDPGPNDRVERGTPVDVILSSGPATVVLSDYSCQTFNKAKADLQKLDLVANFAGTVPPLPQCPNPNFIAFQEPPPGTEVPPGTIVNLYTGGPTSTSTPSP